MRQSLFLPLFSFIISITVTPICSASVISSVFVNEFHYDNEGADSNEFFELAGIAGTNLTDWQLKLFNGSNRSSYGTIHLNGVFAEDSNGFGFLSFDYEGIQNGSPDGFALISPSNEIVQFLSYEGVITAEIINGITITSLDIGVAESSITKKNYSLQLSGIGRSVNDFSWQLASFNTKGFINNNQTFTTLNKQTLQPIPEPQSLFLFIISILLFIVSKSLQRRG